MHSLRQPGLIGLLLAISSVSVADKKPKAQPPHACVKNELCILDLRWSDDTSIGSGAMAIYGTFENRSRIPVANLILDFELLNKNDEVVRAATAYLTTRLPPGGRWAIKASAGIRPGGIFASDVLLTRSAEIRGLAIGQYGDAQESTRFQESLSFEPLFNPGERWAERSWRKNHGTQAAK